MKAIEFRDSGRLSRAFDNGSTHHKDLGYVASHYEHVISSSHSCRVGPRPSTQMGSDFGPYRPYPILGLKVILAQCWVSDLGPIMGFHTMGRNSSLQQCP